MLAACSAVFLTALDQTVVVTALPSMISDLNVPVQQLDRAAWIVSAYLLGYVIAMPLMGRVSDLYGRRLVFIFCLSVFGLASLFCGLAGFLGATIDISFLQHIGINVASPSDIGNSTLLQPGLVWLVAARFVQAAGGGALIPVAMAVAGDYYGPRQRGVALGLIGMVTEAGGVLGPLYGASIVQAFSWHMIFYLNVPLVAILLVLVILLVKPQNKPFLDDIPVPTRSRWRIDFLGALLLGASLVCMSLGLSQEAITTTSLSGVNATPIQNNPILIGAAIILFLSFIVLEIWLERRNGRLLPLVEPSLFHSPAFAASAIVSLLIGAALIIAMADIPLYIATTMSNATALDGGLALLRLTVMIPIGALLGGWLVTRISCRLTAILGLLLTALGFSLMHIWPVSINWTLLTVSTLIAGLGFGLVISPLSTTTINAVQRIHMGMAASVVTLLRMVGMILGLAALTSWGLTRFYSIITTEHPPANLKPFSPAYLLFEQNLTTQAAHDVYTGIFLVAGVLCIAALIPALLLEGRK
jgi:MFS family permease